ncbi:MAG: hypothetical protein WCJ62_06595 [Flavobacterium sp.]
MAQIILLLLIYLIYKFSYNFFFDLTRDRYGEERKKIIYLQNKFKNSPLHKESISKFIVEIPWKSSNPWVLKKRINVSKQGFFGSTYSVKDVIIYSILDSELTLEIKQVDNQ